MTYVVIWSYEVSDDHVPGFSNAYGGRGPWHSLFQKAHGYIKSDLLQDDTSYNHYITLDYWKTQEDYKDFTIDFHEQYQSIDMDCENLTLREEYIGGFQT